MPESRRGASPPRDSPRVVVGGGQALGKGIFNWMNREKFPPYRSISQRRESALGRKGPKPKSPDDGVLKRKGALVLYLFKITEGIGHDVGGGESC